MSRPGSDAAVRQIQAVLILPTATEPTGPAPGVVLNHRPAGAHGASKSRPLLVCTFAGAGLGRSCRGSSVLRRLAPLA